MVTVAGTLVSTKFPLVKEKTNASEAATAPPTPEPPAPLLPLPPSPPIAQLPPSRGEIKNHAASRRENATPFRRPTQLAGAGSCRGSGAAGGVVPVIDVPEIVTSP